MSLWVIRIIMLKYPLRQHEHTCSIDVGIKELNYRMVVWLDISVETHAQNLGVDCVILYG